ncbi:SDR family NAD(P)-dependent oxidoreductase [Vallicoccus soli]|uniref:SDR family NAD(P)-dependent oxidoreductase n=1 Tax=Vallicoccus soli TaxID=2339232 RepID=UPI001402CF6E|nr:SDR family NAD(P)-dependent oxidoreductase [Vallicoccus soli]
MTTTCLTGATDGIGRATARLLARRAQPGDVLLLHARTAERGAPVRDELAGEGPGEVRVVTGDLADLGQVRGLAAQVAGAGPLDALLLNAGVWLRGDAPDRSADGLPATFAVNVLAHHLLTALLRPRLAAAGGRVVWLGSGMARSGRVDPDRLQEPARDAGRAYADSKAADVALALGWARRLEPDGVASLALDPGWVPTKLASAGAPGRVEDSAEALARCAQDPSVRSGTYRKGRGETAVPGHLADAALQDALLAACDRLAGL